MAEEFERIFVIPLKKTGFKSSKAAPVAVKRVKQYLTRHMKVEDEKNIWIDESLNNMLWSHGKYSMPSKIRVKAVKFEDGVVEASLPELELKKSRRELLKEEREKKEPILRRREEEEPSGEGEGVGGAEDYDIAPTAEGDVKIKKKKPSKKKETKEKEEKPEKTTKKPKTKKTPAKNKTSKREEKKIKNSKKTTKPKKSNKKATKKKTSAKKEKK